jgi:uncharacterized protein YycO
MNQFQHREIPIGSGKDLDWYLRQKAPLIERMPVKEILQIRANRNKFRVRQLPSLERLQKGDLIVVGEIGTFISHMIKKISNSPFSHVAMYWQNGKIVEAAWNGVVVNDVYKYYSEKFNAAAFRINDLTERQAEVMLAFALAQEGKGYDWLQFFGLFWLYMTGKRRTEVDVDVHNRFICSELVAKAAEDAGISFSSSFPIENITPADIARSKIVEQVV